MDWHEVTKSWQNSRIFVSTITLTINSCYGHMKRRKKGYSEIHTYRNVDTAEYSCSAGGFLWIVISCAEHLHAWIWWICVCLNFQRPPVLIYRNPSPISTPWESFNTTPKDSTLWISPVISFYVPQKNRISIIASLSLGTSESSWYRHREKQWSVIVMLCFWQSLTLKWTTPV